MENDRIAVRVFVGECVGSHSTGQPSREGLFKEKRGLDVRQSRRMVHDRSE